MIKHLTEIRFFWELRALNDFNTESVDPYSSIGLVFQLLVIQTGPVFE